MAVGLFRRRVEPAGSDDDHGGAVQVRERSNVPGLAVAARYHGLDRADGAYAGGAQAGRSAGAERRVGAAGGARRRDDSASALQRRWLELRVARGARDRLALLSRNDRSGSAWTAGEPRGRPFRGGAPRLAPLAKQSVSLVAGLAGHQSAAFGRRPTERTHRPTGDKRFDFERSGGSGRG